MTTVRWTKLPVNLMDEPRIVYLYSQRYGDFFFRMYMHLRCWAAKVCDDGLIYLRKDVPLTAEDVAEQVKKRLHIVVKGLDVLERLQLIARNEKGMLYLCCWDDIQDIKKYEQQKERQREKTSLCRQRKKERQEADKVVPAKQEGSHAVTEQPVRYIGSAEPSAVGAVLGAMQRKTPDDMPPLKEGAKRYRELFGKISKAIVNELNHAEDAYGSKILLDAIEQAYENKIDNVKRIINIAAQQFFGHHSADSGGQP